MKMIPELFVLVTDFKLPQITQRTLYSGTLFFEAIHSDKVMPKGKIEYNPKNKHVKLFFDQGQ